MTDREKLEIAEAQITILVNALEAAAETISEEYGETNELMQTIRTALAAVHDQEDDGDELLLDS